ncbi:hypothetical protein ACJMK2_033633 [Sinanodonta woodiana]|uniref:Protein kinase domain-containing protein n=1 Tax=Sinanodonta woodiana TaxID=1069815 RepID=A0ABD3WNY9_SINWO
MEICVESDEILFQEERYTTMRMIDYGSFGDVYEVQSQSDLKSYAMKTIVFRGHEEDDPYIMSEIWCLTHLRHKNLIQLKDINVWDKRVDIIMEYAEKENLEKLCREVGPLSLTCILDIYSQIIEGVAYCHFRGVAHRDLTPGNILLTRDNVVKIADFELAFRCCTDESTEEILCTDYLGNTSYLAPEVLSRIPFLSRSADIWSLGILLCFIVYRDIPYKGQEPQVLKAQMGETWRGFVKERTDRLENFKIAQTLLEKCLVIDPILRATVSELFEKAKHSN